MLYVSDQMPFKFLKATSDLTAKQYFLVKMCLGKKIMIFYEQKLEMPL